MKFTRSKDGRLRTNVSIRFRVGIDALEAAAADRVWTRMVDDGYDEDALAEQAEEYASKLTRSAVEKSLRNMLHGKGSNGIEWLVDDQLMTHAVKAVGPVVAKLFPELVQS